MIRKLLIRDLTLRDGQQSAFATRMSQAQIDRVLPYYKEDRKSTRLNSSHRT